MTYVYCSDGRRARLAADALIMLGFDSQCVVALSRGFSHLCASARNTELEESDAALLRPVSMAAPVSKSRGRNMKSFDPETYQLFHALQTSRDYAEYEQVRVLGRGTSASAVLLRAPPGLVSDGDPLVVAKCFQVHSLISDNELKKIHKEVKLLQKLRNKHVIRYLGVFVSGSVASVLMEYAAGGTLAGMIKAAAQERAPFVSARVRRWARQLALGLQYVHEQHVIHRDVTSANILLGDQDAIKITDFGWSTLNTQMATTFAGTPYYMAPEVLYSKPYTAMVDAWSVGVILYELLALERPFNAADLDELKAQVTEEVHVDHRPGTVLGNTRHPVGLCRLATSAALLSGDPLTRMALPELLDALEEGDEEGEDEGGVLDDIQPEAKSSPSDTRAGPQRRKRTC